MQHGPPRDCSPPPGVDPLSYRVFQAFIRSMHMHRQLMMRAVQNGSPLSHAGCLRIVAQHDGVSQRDLAEMMHLSRPTVTGMLQAMEKSGAIERRPDEKDQRLTRVYLTPEGRALSERLRAELGAFMNDTIGEMPEADRIHLAELLDQLSDNIARTLAKAPRQTTEHEEEKTAR